MKGEEILTHTNKRETGKETSYLFRKATVFG